MTAPDALIERAKQLGERAGVARKYGLPFDPCPWRLEDSSTTRRTQAAAWWQTFSEIAGIGSEA